MKQHTNTQTRPEITVAEDFCRMLFIFSILVTFLFSLSESVYPITQISQGYFALASVVGLRNLLIRKSGSA